MSLVSATSWDSLPDSLFPFLLITIQLDTLIGFSFFTILLKLSHIIFLPSLIYAFTSAYDDWQPWYKDAREAGREN